MNAEKYIFKLISDYSFWNQQLYPTLSLTFYAGGLTADVSTITFAMFGH
jgi:hypothetical protein